MDTTPEKQIIKINYGSPPGAPDKFSFRKMGEIPESPGISQLTDIRSSETLRKEEHPNTKIRVSNGKVYAVTFVATSCVPKVA